MAAGARDAARRRRRRRCAARRRPRARTPSSDCSAARATTRCGRHSARRRERHHPDKAGGDRARFEECKAAADAILDRTGQGDEPPRWQRRSKPPEDRDDESHWDHGFGSSERVYNDERDFDEARGPGAARKRQRARSLHLQGVARHHRRSIFRGRNLQPIADGARPGAAQTTSGGGASASSREYGSAVARAPARAARPRAAQTERQLHRRWPEQPAARFCASNSNQRGSSFPAPASAAGRALSGGGGAAHLRTAAPDDALNPIHVRPWSPWT